MFEMTITEGQKQQFDAIKEAFNLGQVCLIMANDKENAEVKLVIGIAFEDGVLPVAIMESPEKLCDKLQSPFIESKVH